MNYKLVIVEPAEFDIDTIYIPSFPTIVEVAMIPSEDPLEALIEFRHQCFCMVLIDEGRQAPEPSKAV